MTLIHRPSPNFDARAERKFVTSIILHYTGMPTFEDALNRLTDPEAKVSAHYAVRADGQVFQLVNEADRAWHAGKSFWKGETDINSVSIGIELENPGHQHGYEAFSDKLLSATKQLVQELLRRHSLGPEAVLGHSDVAPQRKEDPGELFPWEQWAKAGIGVWPRIDATDRMSATLPELRDLLGTIGFEAPSSDYDLNFRRTVLAFQRHWHPTSLTGTPDPETVARIRALARIYCRE